MDQVLSTILGQTPAPNTQAAGSEQQPAALRTTRTRQSIGDNAAGNAGHEQPSGAARPLPSSGSNTTAVSAVAVEAGLNPRDVRELSAAELAKLTELQQRDQEVRSHEQAHIAAGGGLVVGGARYTHTQGPDGQQYAVSGEVSIDTAKVQGDPQATVEKAQAIRRAALAPAQPSGQDQAVAARAQAMETEARMELVQQRRTNGLAAYGAAEPPADRNPASAVDTAV
ncbi:hypothetical protein DPQ33_01900 [Oceanidesulfovibrio indonesiensis]|uniref:SprA-related family protein n=1 Tax=Oceanidesulfovibrio indonesiensis TaxID=54767 RepID=A0A7M3MJN2_9BACT|nr:putative metalloprotease CJM1_0395 family protein [Oceanidesulfovibrio indonesiensis]TVM20004.1 hypothetical protein DPQ33_01900 [Oceanidesulfovibrio indonesiensis]